MDSLSMTQQLIVASTAMFVFFGLHNVLQEALVNSIPNFHNGVMLGYMEVLGVTVCTYLERQISKEGNTRVASFSSYPLLTLCLLSSSALSNLSLNYINFPTKVIFRSCKLIPTMAIATFMNQRRCTRAEYACALAICTGLILFVATDMKLTPSFQTTGIILVSLSVCADAVLPNAQERLFRNGSSRLEVTFYSNIFTLCAMTVSTLYSGDFVEIFRYASSDRKLAVYMLLYTSISYMAVSAYMQIVKRFGAVTAVLLSTARKGMTLVLSFILFPKAFSYCYVLGAALVLGGLLAASLIKARKGSSVGKSRGNVVEETKEMEPTCSIDGNHVYTDEEQAGIGTNADFSGTTKNAEL